jgi:integrase/recombinase XerD
MTALAPTLQAFFTDRLTRQKNASPHTIAAYRDTMRLLLVFAEQRTGTPPSRLKIEDLDASLITAFLDHLEHDRGNSARGRNTRLAAIHSLFGFAALQHPEHAGVIARVLAIPPKRFTRAVVSYLTDQQAQALLAAPPHQRVDRPPGSRPAGRGDPDRAAGLRADRAALQGHPARHWAARELHR